MIEFCNFKQPKYIIFITCHLQGAVKYYCENNSSTNFAWNQEAKYYPIYVDSTSDISHTNQLTFNIRYVLGTATVERLLCFISMERHKRKEIATIMTGFLRDNKIPFQSCRGQFNGNASNMSEKSRCKIQMFILVRWKICCGYP